MDFELTDTGKRIFDLFRESFTASINQSIQKLLNTKHLYQYVEVKYPDPDVSFNNLIPEIRKFYSISSSIEERKTFNQYYNLATKAPWIIVDHDGPRGMLYSGIQVYFANFSISPLTIRSYCKVCKNIEPYNFVRGSEILNEEIEKDFQAQVFTLAFECQGCKSVPEVFLIRREKNKLTLSGRSPIEQVIVPTFLPKEQAKYVSDAIVAYNSGQTLSGLFQLRVFIEQYVRSKSSNPKSEDIEMLFKEYASTLSDNFKTQFPSLNSIYDSLSHDIHSADPNIETYEKAIKDIETHFDAKRLFENNKLSQ